MTNPQIAEIYAIAREGFNGGQQQIQMQSFPFHMTAENMAKYRADQNIGFWKKLKEGADNFEVTREEVAGWRLQQAICLQPHRGERDEARSERALPRLEAE